ncbi:hypothetical protein DRE_04163 [Drechslerella stenobrocha 248]|uniref:BTB domain-containing protein n=1 Tax=Drechslerella stenobrocha 248 TaxID=1043628 RepID=W7HRK9_9PEZI|nr:hypothetical protein DRE_04163 [Drechslerella stenobrocha 248]
MSGTKPLVLSLQPDLYLVLTSVHHPDADFHILVSRQNVCSVSRPLRKAFVAAVTHERKSFYNDEGYPCIKLEWWHRDALIIILKVLHHHPDAFPATEDLTFKTFWGIPATLDTLQIDLAQWFVGYFEYWKPKRLEYGYEPWLVVGRVFGCSDDYARLTAKIIVEFTGWTYGGGMLKGPPGKKALDGGETLEMWEGWAPRDVMGNIYFTNAVSRFNPGA